MPTTVTNDTPAYWSPAQLPPVQPFEVWAGAQGYAVSTDPEREQPLIHDAEGRLNKGQIKGLQAQYNQYVQGTGNPFAGQFLISEEEGEPSAFVPGRYGAQEPDIRAAYAALPLEQQQQLYGAAGPLFVGHGPSSRKEGFEYQYGQVTDPLFLANQRAFQEKYPGYAQIDPTQYVGRPDEDFADRGYYAVFDENLAEYDPEYGLLLPQSQFRFAGKHTPFFKSGFGRGLLTLAAAAAPFAAASYFGAPVANIPAGQVVKGAAVGGLLGGAMGKGDPGSIIQGIIGGATAPVAGAAATEAIKGLEPGLFSDIAGGAIKGAIQGVKGGPAGVLTGAATGGLGAGAETAGGAVTDTLAQLFEDASAPTALMRPEAAGYSLPADQQPLSLPPGIGASPQYTPAPVERGAYSILDDLQPDLSRGDITDLLRKSRETVPQAVYSLRDDQQPRSLPPGIGASPPYSSPEQVDRGVYSPLDDLQPDVGRSDLESLIRQSREFGADVTAPEAQDATTQSVARQAIGYARLANSVYDAYKALTGEDMPVQQYQAPARREGQTDQQYTSEVVADVVGYIDVESLADLGVDVSGLDLTALAREFTPGSPEFLEAVLGELDVLIEQIAGVDPQFLLQGETPGQLQELVRGKSGREVQALQRALYGRGALDSLTTSRNVTDPFSGREFDVGLLTAPISSARAGQQAGLARFGQELGGVDVGEARGLLSEFLERDVDLFGAREAAEARRKRDEQAAALLSDDELRKRFGFSPEQWALLVRQPGFLQQLLGNR